MQCKSSCGSGKVHRYNAYECFSTCAASGYPYGVVGSNMCYEDCSQTENDKVHVSGSFTCMHGCSGTTPFQNNGGSECYDKCPSGKVHRFDAYVCFSTCADTGYMFTVDGENKCYKSCANTASNKFYVPGTYKCLPGCPDTAKYYLESEKVCYQECPARAWFHRQGRTTCHTECRLTGYLYHIDGDHTCYNVCPDTDDHKYNVVGQYICKDKCPSDYPYHVQHLFVCYKKCADTPAKYYIEHEYVCYMVCKNSESHPYYDNGTVLCIRQCRTYAIYHLPG